MDTQISSLIYGVIGGGIATTGLRLIENYLIVPHLSESIEAKKKLSLYAKPLWLAIIQLQFRLNTISQDIENKVEIQFCVPPQDISLDWFTKDGYKVTSTAYMISSVACWISIFERDIVFLKFGRKSLTYHFFKLIEKLKKEISFKSILWFHYFNGIGEQLINENHNRPMTLAEFSYNLYENKLFRAYYDQLFQFLGALPSGKYKSNIDNTYIVLREIRFFLEENKIVMKIN